MRGPCAFCCRFCNINNIYPQWVPVYSRSSWSSYNSLKCPTMVCCSKNPAFVCWTLCLSTKSHFFVVVQDIPKLCGEDDQSNCSSDEEGWLEFDDEDADGNEERTLCLFCTHESKDVSLAIDHVKSEHGIDFSALKGKFNMDQYSFIKVCSPRNFLRLCRAAFSIELNSNFCFAGRWLTTFGSIKSEQMSLLRRKSVNGTMKSTWSHWNSSRGWCSVHLFCPSSALFETKSRSDFQTTIASWNRPMVNR